MAAQRIAHRGEVSRMPMSMLAHNAGIFSASNGDLFAGLDSSSDGPSQAARERLAAVRSAALMSMRNRAGTADFVGPVATNDKVSAQERAQRAVLASKILALVAQQPKGFQNWGNTKTRAWVRMAERYGAAARSHTATANELAQMLSDIEAIPGWHCVDCSRFIETISR